MKDANYWIKTLELLPHPEGGYYKQVYKASENISKEALPQRFSGTRSFATSIYFLLSGKDVSKFHRICSDEVWHFYTGSSLCVSMINKAGERSEFNLGSDFEQDQAFQAVVPAGVWFGASLNQVNGYALVGCTVAPGFDFEDFELADKNALLSSYPQHTELINKLS